MALGLNDDRFYRFQPNDEQQGMVMPEAPPQMPVLPPSPAVVPDKKAELPLSFFDFDPAAIKKESEDNANRKANLGMWGAVGDALSSGQNFGNFFTGKMNEKNNTASRMTGAVSDSIQDPYDRQAKLYSAYKNSMEGKALKEQSELDARLKDPTSKESKALKALAPRWNIEVTPEMSGYEIRQMIDPKKMMETEAAANIDYKKKFDLQKDSQSFQERLQHELVSQKGEEARLTKEAAKADRIGKETDEFRKEFNGLPQTKQMQEVSAAFNKMQYAVKNPSAAGDMALIYGVNKMLDPGSTVREGEFANAENAKAVNEKLLAYWNKVRTGERLTEGQRIDFMNQAQNLYNGQLALHNQLQGSYRDIANKRGIDPGQVFVNFESQPYEKPKAPVQASSSGMFDFLPTAKADSNMTPQVREVGGALYKKVKGGWEKL